MTFRRKLLIVAAILLAAIVVRPSASLHWTRDESSTGMSSCVGSSSQSSGDPNTFSRFVILLPEEEGRARDMQTRVADELKSALAERSLAYNVSPAPFPPNSQSPIRGDWSSRSPEVFVCSSREEAVRQKPDMLIFVRCSKWQCSLWPFVKSYSSEVDVSGGEPSYWRDEAAEAATGQMGEDAKFVSGWPIRNKERFFTYTFSMHVTTDGTMKGIFSGDYLASSVAKAVAKTVADSVDKQVKDAVEKYMSDRQKEARKNDST
jgi:hypothetical protein